MRLVRDGGWFLQLGYFTIGGAWLLSAIAQILRLPDDALLEILTLILFFAAHVFALGFCVTSLGYFARALLLQPGSRTVSTYFMLALSALPLLTVAWLVYAATLPPKV